MGAEPTGQLHCRSSSGDEVRAGGLGNGDGRSPSRSTAPDGYGDPKGLASDQEGDERGPKRSINPGSGDTGTGNRNIGMAEPESNELRGTDDNNGADGRGTPLARRAGD
ncbi:hypothetical protein THAOC_35580 [Thalassiosira oceanica]|uniref:Uncharacterized protein n=1 Tax=Thalassiosira oceanica TaxID=159749 RepID=K0R0P4_THAOC|nr:hypothetical protein THAOC_35580 [Thalassiosira oceanica]|eukprot:EJK45788.1 hypothetical protein THAOC_35580 [Thalassiosira oceanica]